MLDERARVIDPSMDTISCYVSRAAPCTTADASLEQANGLMRDAGVRHLPVLERGRPVGVLAERDVTLAANLSNRTLDTIRVAEVMSGVPYCVNPGTPVGEVARHLALRKLDVALVRSGTNALGVFALPDALRLLASLVDPEHGGA